MKILVLIGEKIEYGNYKVHCPYCDKSHFFHKESNGVVFDCHNRNRDKKCRFVFLCEDAPAKRFVGPGVKQN